MILIFALLVPLCGPLAGCSMRSAAPHNSPISHPVLFTLHDSNDAAELIADCDELLPGIPGVVAYSSGTPLDTGREMVDSNFDVGLFVGFDSVESYDAYITHPNHVALVEKWMPRIAVLRVHDILDHSAD